MCLSSAKLILTLNLQCKGAMRWTLMELHLQGVVKMLPQRGPVEAETLSSVLLPYQKGVPSLWRSQHLRGYLRSRHQALTSHRIYQGLSLRLPGLQNQEKLCSALYQ